MEQIAKLHIEKLPEGVYLATSEDIPGVIAQGRTIQETLEIARDVGKVPGEQERILPVVDSLLRDAKARQPYRISA